MNIVYLSDTSGTGLWRRIFQQNAINCIGQGLGVSVTASQIPVLDYRYYQSVNSITVQRWINDQQCDMFCNFFKPLMDSHSGWLVYEIDDNMSDECIPKYNRGRKAFEGERIQSNIKKMLNTADFVTVTTDRIKSFYHEHYGVPLENIIAVPNLLPRWWFGDKYNAQMKIDQFKHFKSKPRIGIVSSLSHYNIDNVMEDMNGLATRLKKKPDGTEVWLNERNVEVPANQLHKIEDDFDGITECVRQTINDFQWVFFGYCPPQVQDLANAHKVEVHGGVPLLNYASKLYNLNLQAIVAPVKKMEFNYCKSFIKTMECAALGIPLFATNCLPYSRVMDKDFMFDSAAELKDKLMRFKWQSYGAYQKTIEKQWKWLNSPAVEGDFHIRNFWLEDNLTNVWLPIFKMRQKGIKLSMKNFMKNFEAKKAEEDRKMLYKSESGKAVVTL